MKGNRAAPPKPDHTSTLKNNTSECPDCGRPGLKAGSICPHCALNGALCTSTSESPRHDKTPDVRQSSRRFGDYELLELIGRGGMGIVYKAHQFSLNQFVALKMMLDGRSNSTKAIRRFHLEAEAAARLRHPNIVRIYHVGEEDGDAFLTMELIHGESLSRRIARGEFRLPPSEASKAAIYELQTRIARMMATTARAAHYAHEQGVLHRDIKPGNIIVDDDGEPHLTDFGLAKLEDGDTSFTDSASIAGTPAYMSPEQARGGKLTAAADTYSLGVILYELLTGRTPFHGATPVDTLRQITDLEPPNPVQTTNGLVDADLATICLKCLEKNPIARYATSHDLAEDLDRWLRREPIRARPIGGTERLLRWARRNPLGASFIAVLTIGILGTSLLLLQLWRSEDQARRRAENIRDGILASIEELWPNPERQFEYISSEQLSAFLDGPKSEVDYEAPWKRLTVGVSVTESPLSQAQKYARPFQQIEDQMSKTLGLRVLIDLKLFKFKNVKVAEAISGTAGKVDFVSVGALSYVKAKSLQPGLIPIARDDKAKPAVFFSKKGSGISNLNQVVGKRMAFGNPGATISLTGKVLLVQTNILGTKLESWQHWNSKSNYLARLLKAGLRNKSPGRSHSHAAAIEAVTNNLADVGVSRREYVQDLTKHWLQVISGFESPPQLWVASTNVSLDVVDAFRQALIGSETIELIGGPDQQLITRIVPVDDSYYDSIRRALTNEVLRFEGERPVQSADPEELFEDDE